MTRVELFNNYLAVTGFDLSPLAWHFSGIPMSNDQHQDVINLLGGNNVGQE